MKPGMGIMYIFLLQLTIFYQPVPIIEQKWVPVGLFGNANTGAMVNSGRAKWGHSQLQLTSRMC